MKRRNETEITWEDYFREMEARFSEVRRISAMADIKNLQMTGSIDDYIEAFDDLLTEVDNQTNLPWIAS